MLLSWTPVPGTRTPEQDPLDVVIDATIPSESITLTCVVPLAEAGEPDFWVFGRVVQSLDQHPRRRSRVDAAAAEPALELLQGGADDGPAERGRGVGGEAGRPGS